MELYTKFKDLISEWFVLKNKGKKIGERYFKSMESSRAHDGKEHWDEKKIKEITREWSANHNQKYKILDELKIARDNLNDFLLNNFEKHTVVSNTEMNRESLEYIQKNKTVLAKKVYEHLDEIASDTYTELIKFVDLTRDIINFDISGASDAITKKILDSSEHIYNLFNDNDDRFKNISKLKKVVEKITKNEGIVKDGGDLELEAFWHNFFDSGQNFAKLKQPQIDSWETHNWEKIKKKDVISDILNACFSEINIEDECELMLKALLPQLITKYFNYSNIEFDEINVNSLAQKIKELATLSNKEDDLTSMIQTNYGHLFYEMSKGNKAPK